ncbi:MAG: MscL family protein [Candidatus Hodarchaeota archaeon]
MSNDEMLEELREIRKLLTPPPKPDPPEGFINEFMDFLSKYKVLGLAVAFILGLYLGALVQALVDDLIMPVVQIFVPSAEGWEGITFLEIFRVGHFAGQLLTFLIMAFVIFLIVKIATRIGIE